MPETGRDAGDACLMPHNPEVAGSNPAPATKVRGRLSIREAASCSLSLHPPIPGSADAVRRRRPRPGLLEAHAPRCGGCSRHGEGPRIERRL